MSRPGDLVVADACYSSYLSAVRNEVFVASSILNIDFSSLVTAVTPVTLILAKSNVSWLLLAIHHLFMLVTPVTSLQPKMKFL